MFEDLIGAITGGFGDIGNAISGAASGIGSFLAGGAEPTFQNLLPTLAPLAGAGIGGILGGGKGALEGGLGGAALGQLAGTGPLALLAPNDNTSILGNLASSLGLISPGGTGTNSPLIQGASGVGGAGGVTPSAAGGSGSWLLTPGGGAGGAGAAPGFLDTLKKNGSWLLPALGLGVSALSQPKIPYSAQQGKIAGQLSSQGSQLASTLTTGKLPPGAQSYIDAWSQGQVAAVKSKYAALGMSGSTSEMQDIASVQQQAAAMQFQFATTLTTTGINELGMASGIYGQQAQILLQQDQGLMTSISNFAAASALSSALTSKRT